MPNDNRVAPPPLDALIQCRATTAGWEDLVLPEPTKQSLHEIASRVVQLVGLQERGESPPLLTEAQGTCALFAGPTGTGKTMAAQVLAKYLDVELWRIDFSEVVNKYIGETEKNLDHVFAAADVNNAILFLDEADALLGKRSDVKDAHDRYANPEVRYLLRRIESHPGLVILTSNLRTNIDSAFMRRLHYIIEFSRPERALRYELWRRVFSPRIQIADDVDYARLAELDLTGGNIRDIGHRAVLKAATLESHITMSLINEAAKAEMRKLGILSHDLIGASM